MTSIIKLKHIFVATVTSIMLISTAAAGDLVMKLAPDDSKDAKESNGDYVDQVIKKFDAVLKSNKVLKKQFDQFETDAVGDEQERGGRYLGVHARGIVMHTSEVVDFKGEDDTSTRDYTQTIVVHYSYGEGFRRGMESVSGVFATFEIKGSAKYKLVKDDHELNEHKVTATFKGFSKTLLADKKMEEE